jgi:hypothetical protein
MALLPLLATALLSAAAQAFPIAPPALNGFTDSFADPQSAGIKRATTEELLGMTSARCSGSLVEFNRKPEAKAVMITNGHCSRGSLLRTGEVIKDVPYVRPTAPISVGTRQGFRRVTVSRVLYGTMTGTDMALIELNQSYKELTDLGAKVYGISDKDPAVGTLTRVVSGFWEERQDCTVVAHVKTLLEGEWTFTNSFAFDQGCLIRGGYSGTPVVDPASDLVVAIVNTTNERGVACAINNPCEVGDDGKKTAIPDRGYAQRVTDIPACVSAVGEIDFALSGCRLQKPSN